MVLSGIPIVDPSPCWCSITRGYLAAHTPVIQVIQDHPSHPSHAVSSCAGEGDLLPNEVRPPRCDVCWFANPITMVPFPIPPSKSKNIHQVGSTWLSQIMHINSTTDFAVMKWNTVHVSWFYLGEPPVGNLAYIVPHCPTLFHQFHQSFLWVRQWRYFFFNSEICR